MKVAILFFRWSQYC